MGIEGLTWARESVQGSKCCRGEEVSGLAFFLNKSGLAETSNCRDLECLPCLKKKKKRLFIVT